MAVVLVVVVGLGVVAVLATARGGQDDSGAATAPVELDGDTLEAVPSAVPPGPVDPASDPAVGATAADLTGTGFDGEKVSITADGRVKAVYFLAHWCPHCQAEVPVIRDLIDTGSVPAGLDLYAVSTRVDETRPNFPPGAWLAEEGLEMATIRDDADDSAFRAYGAGGLPYVVLLDGDNRVIGRSAGELSAESTMALWAAALGGQVGR